MKANSKFEPKVFNVDLVNGVPTLERHSLVPTQVVDKDEYDKLKTAFELVGESMDANTVFFEELGSCSGCSGAVDTCKQCGESANRLIVKLEEVAERACAI